MSVNSKMTALADEVREISGATGKLGIDAMTSNLGNANTEIGSQATTIAEIAELLNGKSVPGGEANVETCTVKLVESRNTICACFYSAYENGVKTYHYIANSQSCEYTLENIICDSSMTVTYDTTLPDAELSGGLEMVVNWSSIGRVVTKACVITAPKVAGSIGTITLIDND